MKRLTPRQRINQLTLNAKLKHLDYFCTENAFILLIESNLHEKATKIMNSLNQGFLWSNEREVHDKIYNLLLDGVPVKQIKKQI